MPGRRQDPEVLAADRHLAHREVRRIDGGRGVRLAGGVRRTEVRTRAQVVEQPLGAAVMVAVAVGEEDGLQRIGGAQAQRLHRRVVEGLHFVGGVAGVHLHEPVRGLDQVLPDIVVADEPDVIEDLRQGNAILRVRSGPGGVVPAPGSDDDLVVVVGQVAVERARVLRHEGVAADVAGGGVAVHVGLRLRHGEAHRGQRQGGRHGTRQCECPDVRVLAEMGFFIRYVSLLCE